MRRRVVLGQNDMLMHQRIDQEGDVLLLRMRQLLCTVMVMEMRANQAGDRTTATLDAARHGRHAVMVVVVVVVDLLVRLVLLLLV